jgi:hypothetical protein
MIRTPLERLEEEVLQAFGPGSAVSLDREIGRIGWWARVWDRRGSCLMEVWNVSKARVIKHLRGDVARGHRPCQPPTGTPAIDARRRAKAESDLSDRWMES